MNKPLHYNYYYYPITGLTLLGIANSAYLEYIHYKNFTDITYASFCALSQTINCDTVAQSSWSIVLGMPVALWGLVGYLFYFSLLVTVRKGTGEKLALWPFLQLLGFCYAMVSLSLGFIAAYIIHSHCLLCVLNHGINFLLFFYSWIITRRFYKKRWYTGLKDSFLAIRKNTLLQLSFGLFPTTLFVVGFTLPHYWLYNYPPDNSALTTGVTETGSPWIGALEPVLTIEEFTDYQCFQCGKLHYFLRQMVKRYPDKIRLIHHHFPLDHRYNPLLKGQPFHNGSGEMALLAIYASSKGKFWEMNDTLYRFAQAQHAEIIDLQTLGEKVALDLRELELALQDKETREKLLDDIRNGLRHGITSTPTYRVNGSIFQGNIPQHVLSIDE